MNPPLEEAIQKSLRYLVQAAMTQRPAPIRILLIGSQARGDAHSTSDIDVAFEFEGNAQPTATEWAAFCLLIREHAPTLRSFDLVRLDQAPAELREVVKREGVALYPL